MDLLSAFKRKKPAAPEGGDGVQLARTRARQRLIGAAVLVAAGVIGFPLLFETQPRPIPLDLPIEIPPKEGAAPLTMSSPSSSTEAQSAAKPSARPAPPAEQVIDETAADAGREVRPPAASAPAATDTEPTSSKAAVAGQGAPGKQPASAPAVAAGKGAHPAPDDGARAKALLEGKAVTSTDAPASATGTARFVVQVGAFTDPVAMKAARAKVERLGLKTYTQVAQTSAGARTRVRVGPFATRAEAERAAARIKGADLPTVILAL